MFSKEEFEIYWKEWSEREEANYSLSRTKTGQSLHNYLKKGYVHFDLKFWFPDRKDELRKILQAGLKFINKKSKREEWWAFSPFLKLLLKTPRYRYQESEHDFGLETKIRPICFASHIDGLIFGFYSYALTKKYEVYISDKGLNDCVIAYRSNLNGKCNIQFAKEVFDEVKRRKQCTAIALDIKGYFDHIDHIVLKEKWEKIIGGRLPEDQYRLYKILTQYSYVGRDSILKKYDINLKKRDKPPLTLLDLIPGTKTSEKFGKLRTDKLLVVNNKPSKKTGRLNGIPQGSGMSALLSNMYLVDFDKDLQEKAENEGFFYRRYCDDILIICDSEKATSLQQFTIEKIAKEYFLEIQDKKVEMTEFRLNSKGQVRAFNKKKELSTGVKKIDATTEKTYYKSLQYLGFEFNGQSIFIRSSSLSRYFRKMHGRIIKTVVMSYSKNAQSDKIWKRQLFERYSHLGKRNFLTYAYNASSVEYKNSSKETKEGLDSLAIRKQVSRHFQILLNTLRSKNDQRFSYKQYKGKAKRKKEI